MPKNAFTSFLEKLITLIWYPMSSRKFPAGRSAQNLSSNKLFPPITSPVNDQRTDPAALLHYGNYTLSYNGCAPLALFCALWSQNCLQPLSLLIFQMESAGCLSLGGKLGTNPYRLGRVLRDLPVCCERFHRLSRLEEALLPGDAAILFIWNDRSHLKKGAHFFTVIRESERYRVYNRLTACDDCRQLSSIVGNGNFVLGYRIRGI